MSGVYGLTPKQLAVARAIAELTDLFGHAPTFVEIAAELEMTPSRVHALVERLIERGWVGRYKRRSARGLRLLHTPPPVAEFDFILTDEARDYLEARAS